MMVGIRCCDCFTLFIFIKVLNCNCRGAGNTRFCSSVNDYRRLYNFDILMVAEPRVNSDIVDKIMTKLNLVIVLVWKLKVS
jgi:hypothetical protein